jgi:ABC-type Na+ efflux pump permease subunit
LVVVVVVLVLVILLVFVIVLLLPVRDKPVSVNIGDGKAGGSDLHGVQTEGGERLWKIRRRVGDMARHQTQVPQIG